MDTDSLAIIRYPIYAIQKKIIFGVWKINIWCQLTKYSVLKKFSLIFEEKKFSVKNKFSAKKIWCLKFKKIRFTKNFNVKKN